MIEQAGDGDRREPPSRRSFAHFVRLSTRWMDVDVYGHVNNVEYYSYFDTAVAVYLTQQAGLNPRDDRVIGLVVETGCTYRRSINFPETIEVGLRITRLGTTSATYEIAIFKEGEADPAAVGRFVHVYCERDTQRPVPIPSRHRAALERLRSESGAGD